MQRQVSTRIAALPLMALLTAMPVHAEQPSYDEIAATNVALTLEGFSFPGGTTKKQNGKPTCDGLEVDAEARWAGSGFIVREDGTLITNFHVANRARRGVAKFDDGARFDIGFIKAYSRSLDLATMQLQGSKKQQAVKLGDSDIARPLDQVLAVGNPKGSGLNLTEGKISQVTKDDYGKPVVIRHTAPITGGNSGGALYRGKVVVGVNTRTWTGTQFHQAVPINLAKALLEPQHDKAVLLEKAFSPNIFKEKRSLKEVYSVEGEVSAADKEGKGGKGNATTVLGGLTDYVIHVETDADADLDVVVRGSEGDLVACGASNDLGEETIVKSMDYADEVRIELINNMDKKVPVKLRVFSIEW